MERIRRVYYFALKYYLMSASKYEEKYEKSKKSNARAWIAILVIAALIRFGIGWFQAENDELQYNEEDTAILENYTRMITANLTYTKWLEYDVTGTEQLTITYAYTGTQKGKRTIYFTTPAGMCAVENSFTFELPAAEALQNGLDVPTELHFAKESNQLGKCTEVPDKVAFYLANNALDPKLTTIKIANVSGKSVISIIGLNRVPYEYDHFKENPDAEPEIEYTREERNAIAKNRTKARKELKESLQFLPGDITNAKVKISSYTNSVTLETNKGAVNIGKLNIKPDGYVLETEHWLPETSKDTAPTAKWKNVTYLNFAGKQKRGNLGIYFLPGVGESMLYLGEI